MVSVQPKNLNPARKPGSQDSPDSPRRTNLIVPKRSKNDVVDGGSRLLPRVMVVGVPNPEVNRARRDDLMLSCHYVTHGRNYTAS